MSLEGQRPNLGCSGINMGSNLGSDVLYSGTVAAALEGIICGIPSVAFSVCDHDATHFDAFETLVPSVYGDFFEGARDALDARRREALHRLLTFRFTRHPRYNLPPKRLKLLEKQIQMRAMRLLDEEK